MTGRLAAPLCGVGEGAARGFERPPAAFSAMSYTGWMVTVTQMPVFPRFPGCATYTS